MDNVGSTALLIGNFGHQVRDDLLYYLLLDHLELGALLLRKSEKPILYAISFEVGQLSEEYPELDVRVYDKKLSELLSVHEFNSPLSTRESSLPLKVAKELEEGVDFPGTEKIVAEKLPEEIERMRMAAKITDDIFDLVVQKWRTFNTEKDVARFITEQAIARDVDISFPPIVASGANASNPHHHPQADSIKSGFCIIDMGVRYKGYCSDMSRTLYVGNPSSDEIQLYNTIAKFQHEAVTRCFPGANGKEIDQYVRDGLGDDLSPLFVHSLGHGLGTQVHEWPRISQKVDVVLKENMIITIEPGIYSFDKYGIRIEDDVLITKKGPEVLTSSSKELVTV